MAFTVRAVEHLSCTETVFPRMRDRVSLLLRRPAPLTVFRPPGRRCRMPFGKEYLQGAVCREGCSGRFRTASATAHRRERCDLLRTNVRHCLPDNAGGSPPPPCGSPLLSRFFGCPGRRPAFRRRLVRFRRGAAPQDLARSFPKAEAAAACGTHPAGGTSGGG